MRRQVLRTALRGVRHRHGGTGAPSVGGRVVRSPSSAAREAGLPANQDRQKAGLAAVDDRRDSYFEARNVRVEIAEASGYRNVDGERIDDGRYTRFKEDVARIVTDDRIITDTIRKFAYGTDASFYRLVPQVVVKVKSEKEVQAILPIALKHRTPVTFRAAGTSLSGQAITDSVLLKLSHTGKAFRNFEIKVRPPLWCLTAEMRPWLAADCRTRPDCRKGGR